MKKIHSVIAVIGLVVLAGLAWWWQNGKAAAPAVAGAGRTPPAQGTGGAGGSGGAAPGSPAAVEVARAVAATLVDDVAAVGSLKSVQGVMLRPEVSGRIAQLGFADGARVKRGQLLVQLDDALQQAQLKQADAQASIARTNLQRSRELLAQRFVSQSAVDQNMANLEVAEAQVTLARAQLARLKILAPFDGTAGLRVVDVGDYVKDGADIVNIEDLSSLTVKFAVPERVLDRLRAGQPVDVTLDALPGRSFKGTVQAVDAQVDANGRALQVLAKVENPGSLLRPGMFARARVVFSVREGAVLVPEEALVPLDARQYLFKVTEGSGGGKVSTRVEARLGQRLPGKVEILQDIKAGDVVVTAGHNRLLRGGDGQPVRIIEIGQAAAAASAPAGPAAPVQGPGPVPARVATNP